MVTVIARWIGAAECTVRWPDSRTDEGVDSAATDEGDYEENGEEMEQASTERRDEIPNGSEGALRGGDAPQVGACPGDVQARTGGGA